MFSHQKCRAWLSSFRLQTLPLAISTILVANAIAFWQGEFRGIVFVLTLLTAIQLQITSNLANDYGDVSKGSDIEARKGPKRGIHSGQITLSQLKKALYISVGISVLLGLLLLFVACRNGYEILFFIGLGLLSIIAAITYTVGKNPYGYHGLGDISVLIFFGFVGVMGSYYLQVGSLPIALIFPSIMCGGLSMGVLNINNMRDYESDRLVDKRTIVVMMGLESAKYYHIGLLVISFISLFLFLSITLPFRAFWVVIVLVPLYIQQIYFLFENPLEFKKQLFPMVRLALLTSGLVSLAIILCE